MQDYFADVPKLLEKLTPSVIGGKIKFPSHILEDVESAVDGLNLFACGGNRDKLAVKLQSIQNSP